MRLFVAIIGVMLLSTFGAHGAEVEEATQPPGCTLDLFDAEVWAWQKSISGQCGCVGEGGSVSIQINGEAVTPTALSGPAPDGGFEATINLVEGENRIVATCTGPAGETYHSEAVQLTERLRDRPKAWIELEVLGDRIELSAAASKTSQATGAKITEFHWVPRPDNPEPLRVISDDAAHTLSLSHPTRDGEYYVELRVVDANGREDTATSYFVVERGIAREVDLETEHAAWIDSAVVYGVVPRNFGIFGFQSVIDRLDDLADIGVTALWMAPVTDSPSLDFGYAVTDYFNVRPEYGSNDDFGRLVDEAHARGIRVLLDFVPNHSSIYHRYYRDTEKRGASSPYWDFYDRDETGAFNYFFTWRELPNLNYENPEVRRWMMEVLAYWVREYDVDGYRIDVAWGLEMRRPSFWPEVRRELKRIKPDVLLIAEASAREGRYFENRYDAAYDWTFRLGEWAWQDVFVDPEYLTYRLDQALTNRGFGFHDDALIFRFLNNNDTGLRFITRHGPEMTRVSTALLLTLPGLPTLYTGDEVGAHFQPYYNSGTLNWNDRYGLRDFHRHLVHLRQETPSLHSRLWERVDVAPFQSVYAYLRYTSDAEHPPALVLLNFSDQAVTAEFTLPDRLAKELGSDRSMRDLISGERFQASPASEEGPVQIELKAYQPVILVP